MEPLKITKTNSTYSECKIYDSLVTVMEWINKDGFELQLCNKYGAIQHISITYSEFDEIKKCIEALENN